MKFYISVLFLKVAAVLAYSIADERLICPENQEWSNCVCGPTCNNSISLICPLEHCQEGCACKPEFVRDMESGGCILPQHCPNRKCRGPHEIYKECGTACPLICGEPIKPCHKNCVQGCFCQDGFVRARKGGGEPIKPCHKNCVQGCFCQDGFVRARKGEIDLSSSEDEEEEEVDVVDILDNLQREEMEEDVASIDIDVVADDNSDMWRKYLERKWRKMLLV
ncbi:Trypsin Inhibitor like cysteine rich domain [Popillia japonica]|uniref:Trypsin Inhibitor like cysteine rich domain n=1 Tax=Popillia japonica TaxID=7064 RepID=A0AAW1HUJ4_POPJA